VEVARAITEAGERLTPAERRVADVVLQHPQLVAFGTVADLASEAGSGAATVVRLAGKLGFDGFTGLQGAVQGELGRKLRPAAERIREPAPTDLLGRSLAIELDNVHETLQRIDPEAFAAAVELLTDHRRKVRVLSGEASRGVATQFAGELDGLRDGVLLLDGNEVVVLRDISLLEQGDVVVAVDLRRYDRWTVQALGWARDRNCNVIALSDSALSPIATGAVAAFTVLAVGGGPFDSHVGTLALLNTLVTACADRLRTSATIRLDRLENSWRAAGALEDLR
jgi:DNA-binding MurR/RpiR family transcriptional regulator